MDNIIYVAGVDEAGRGPLAGPVYAAAVILNPQKPISGLTDSKKLSEKRRDYFFDLIIEKAAAYGIAHATVEEIDEHNILQASLLAMSRAIHALSIKPHRVKIDGTHAPKINLPVETIIKGDLLVSEISAASILAKVSRDRIMIDLHEQYPHYNFKKHKGYGTAEHCDLLKQYGACAIHRKSFAPVKNALYKDA